MTNVVARLVAINFYTPLKGLDKDFTKWPAYKTLSSAVHQSINRCVHVYVSIMLSPACVMCGHV
jgi:hypothetical protein